MSITFNSSTHGQRDPFLLLCTQMWTAKRIQLLKKKNLIRLIIEKGFGDNRKGFAELLNMGEGQLSQLTSEKSKTNIGPKTMADLCNTFNVGPGYFDFEDVGYSPQPVTVQEMNAIYLTREAIKIGGDAAKQLDLALKMVDSVINTEKKKGQTGEEEIKKAKRSLAIIAEIRKPKNKKGKESAS